MDELINFFCKQVGLTNEEIAFIRENTRIVKIAKNHILLSEGKISRAFYFIVRGCIRLFYVSNGQEKTAYFYTENMFVSSYHSFTKQVPANHNLATVEDCELVVFDLESVDKFINFSSTFELLARIMMEEELIAYQEIISSFVTKNTEERYLDLIENRSELIKRIPQHQIATFLGVSPETLSRIRKRIYKKR